MPELFGEPDFLPLERRARARRWTSTASGAASRARAAKTIIPAHAHAKVSCRLVADMDPVATFERVRDARRWRWRRPGVSVDVQLINDGHVDPDAIDHPATVAAADSLRGGLRRATPLPARGRLDPGGGLVRTILGLPVVLLGFTNPDDQAHAPNENMRLANYEGGLRTIVRYWAALRGPAPVARSQLDRRRDGAVGTDGVGR